MHGRCLKSVYKACREETALDVGNECGGICGDRALFDNVLSGQHEEGHEYSRTKYCAGTV